MLSRPFRSITALLALTGLAAVTAPAHAQRDGGRGQIVNGVLTQDYPSVGALLTPSNPNTGRLLCSGTMIGCETFLTAAHCVCGSDGADCTGPNPPDPGSFMVFLQHAGFFSVTSVVLRSEFSFPIADVAVLKLGSPIDGVPPAPIDTAGPTSGTAGTIVGFGNSGGGASDYGIKRVGSVTTGSCADPGSDSTSVCWNFSAPLDPPGEESNTCNGDSGGPLFIDYGAGPTVAGITSGGQSSDCLPEDLSYDARVATYAAWIQGEGGPDLDNTSCGGLPQVGTAAVTVTTFSGQLSETNPDDRYSFDVPSGSNVLRVTLNSSDNAFSDYDLYIKNGGPPTTVDFGCAANGPNQYGLCEFTPPTLGTWHVLVDRVAGSVGTGSYQVTVTLFGNDCTEPGTNGLPCDDHNSCTENEQCQAGTCTGTPIANGTPCDDGNECTGPDTCEAGTCATPPLNGTPCEDGSRCTLNDTCQEGSCTSGPAPALACKQPFVAGKASVLLKDKPGGTDKLLWKWLKGTSTSLEDFGDPTSTATFALCVYDESGGGSHLMLEKTVNPGANWISSGNGFKYKDRRLLNGPVSSLLLRSGDDGAAKIILRAKGGDLGLGSLEVDELSLVRVQLVNEEQCWEASYNGASTSPGQFRAKSE